MPAAPPPTFGAPAEAAAASLPRRSVAGGDRAVGAWLLACALLVAMMVSVGGATRLTHSGLSIVDWAPITGALPPLGADAWQREFRKYRQTPEFRLVNHDITVAGFKAIYLVEWGHRLLGRAAAVLFLLPWLIFLATGRIGWRRAAGYLAWFAVGGLQGGIGWLMVRSGLAERPRVSPFWLTGHLLTALVLFSALLWNGLGELRAPPEAAPPDVRRLRGFANAALALTAVAITWGGLMAGLRAGVLFATFPTLNGAWIPAGMLTLGSPVRDITENPLTVHFLHRALAYLASLAAVVLAVACHRAGRRVRRGRARESFDDSRVNDARLRRGARWVLAVVALQVTLGALTVLLHVPVVIAAAHQANAVALVATLLWVRHILRAPVAGAQRP